MTTTSSFVSKFIDSTEDYKYIQMNEMISFPSGSWEVIDQNLEIVGEIKIRSSPSQILSKEVCVSIIDQFGNTEMQYFSLIDDENQNYVEFSFKLKSFKQNLSINFNGNPQLNKIEENYYYKACYLNDNLERVERISHLDKTDKTYLILS
jgi:hypothetical protein